VKVGQMRELIESLGSEDQSNQRTVEFVMDAKKYFAEDVKAGTDTMAFTITRDNYHPLTLGKLQESLKIASAGLEVDVFHGKKKLNVASSFMTDTTLELVLE
jgi:hypothetical protein